MGERCLFCVSICPHRHDEAPHTGPMSVPELYACPKLQPTSLAWSELPNRTAPGGEGHSEALDSLDAKPAALCPGPSNPNHRCPQRHSTDPPPWTQVANGGQQPLNNLRGAVDSPTCFTHSLQLSQEDSRAPPHAALTPAWGSATLLKNNAALCAPPCRGQEKVAIHMQHHGSHRSLGPFMDGVQADQNAHWTES